MQVRKFEARTIKEAIDLVKFHLGPDAIILAAKENVKGFGLMGQTSVEVTAAISDSKLRNKMVAESKLDTKSKQKFLASSAQAQKKYIEKVFREPVPQTIVATPPVKEVRTPRVATSTRYAEILEDGELPQAAQAVSVAPPAAAMKKPPQQVTQQSRQAPDPSVANLKNEISHLKGMLTQFQNIPQSFMSFHPGAEHGLPFELSSAFKKLTDAGISVSNVVRILRTANDNIPAEQKKKRAFVDGWLIKYLLEHVDICESPFKKRMHVFIGPTGQGKTSMLVKIACYLIMKQKKRVALVTGDKVKVGAPDQMKIYAQILNVPCALISQAADWAPILKAFENADYILVDTPGMTLKGTAEFDLLRGLMPPNMREVQTHYVQSIMARDNDACEVAERYQVLGFDDVILTRLDEAVQHGLAYNFHKKFEVPLHSFGIGGNIPEDFELATKERVVDLLFNLSNFRKNEA